MVTTEIGYTLISTYNATYSTTYSAKEFFTEVFHKLFYDDVKYMNWITNSPIVQGIRKSAPPNESDREHQKLSLIEKISRGACDASVGVGYPSSEVTATTSNQITSMSIIPSEEDLYASWVGGGLGIGISGGLSMFINKPSLLLSLFEGWKYYRTYLTELPNLKSNQIDAWNSQWLCHYTDNRSFNSDEPLANFNPFKTGSDGVTKLVTKAWTTVVFALSKLYPNETITPYVCAIAKTNRTFGYIPILLHQARKPIQLYKKLFGQNEYLQDAKTINKLFGKGDSFYVACTNGVIGVNQMKPTNFNRLFELKLKSKTSDEDIISYKTYITYILAIMDNKELYPLSIEVAKTLNNYANSATRGKSTNSREIENLLSSTSQTKFLENLLPILENSKTSAIFSELISVINSFSHENYKRFVVLIKLNIKLT